MPERLFITRKRYRGNIPTFRWKIIFRGLLSYINKSNQKDSLKTRATDLLSPREKYKNIKLNLPKNIKFLIL